MPHVFVTYTHDSQNHKDDVRFFSRLLREVGIDVTLDQWAEGVRQDWSSWATQSILTADYVLVIASPQYAAAGDGLGPSTTNPGVRSEAAILRNLLHSQRDTWTPKLLPVILPGRQVTELPHFVLPHTVDHYVITDLTNPGITDLVRVITNQPRLVRPPLGTIPHLPPDPEPDLTNGHRRHPTSLETYAATISPICLSIRARLVQASNNSGDLVMETTSGRDTATHLVENYHEVMTEGWWDLSKIPLPTSEDDRRRIRAWQESYLRLKDSLANYSRQMEAINHRPGLMSYFVRPFTNLVAGQKSLELTSQLSHQCELLGIANPVKA
ncbi:hypothetical protein JOD54_004311 [Actinokineospora baliensis]|uniref:toll/interleukin-1 receptor domain-containing protein n=1 Tax=Actinokineospora baliensis TaxID=547056 RepID=UPI00195B7B70|nr:toll/interleukin-1 receptor domain-containing protein [Actinokineospora baliensis]MBM7774107.1 hypothetical protein [Actinokineospora baliensis]